MEFPRPKVLVSSCLEFEKVRYNGQVMPSTIVRDLMPFVEFIKVCPEYEIGLGVPREPIRIVKKEKEYRLIQHNTDRDVTDDMIKFSDKYINNLEQVDGFIFKSRSPTMGVKNIKVYAGMKGSPVIGKCNGFFAGRVVDKFEGYPIEEDDRLRNPKIREHFLIKLFLFAGYRTQERKVFHEHNRLLLKYYNKQLSQNLDVQDESYIEKLKEIMEQPPGIDANTEFFKDLIHTHDIINQYRANTVSFETIKEVTRLMIDKKELNQSFFNPYPVSLKPKSEVDRERNYWK